MGLVMKLFLLTIPIGLGFVYLKLSERDPIPKVEDKFWGPQAEQGKKEDVSIRPFKIEIPTTVIDDLKARLKRELDSNRLVQPLEDTGFEYGFNSKFLKKVGDHWLNKYDWKAREKLLNKFPQYKTKIGGLDIHFYHVKPTAKPGVTTKPILVIHGWPGSVVEHQKIIPLLSQPKDSKYNFEVIVPSLPGYGFSSGAARRGMGTVEMANIFKRLMDRLGHKKFFVMGGDYGGVITHDISTLYPDSVIAAQSALCMDLSPIGAIKHTIASTFPSFFAPPEIAKQILPIEDFLSFIIRESGYFHIQATKPDTVGVGLTHSPLGLAAYILEKFSTGTNRQWISREDGGILEKFTMDELLDNVMIYWVTGSMTTAARLYAEVLLPTILRIHTLARVPTNVPFDCFYLPNDMLQIAEWAVNSKFTNIQRFTIAPKGGHFHTMEEPQMVADDAVSFFNTF